MTPSEDADVGARRSWVRTWLEERPDPTATQLATAGLVAPHWPRPWGLDATPTEQLVIAEELQNASVDLPVNAIALGWAGPTIIEGGTPAQQRRWLPGILDGSEQWTQLFTEPDAGSDLASLRTTAVRDGDHYVVNGQKVFSTWAATSRWGILLARTDSSSSSHAGISYFGVDMSSPGVDVRTLTEMTGGNHFNETFFTDVHVPVGNRIGDENAGWRLAQVTLANERISLSEGGVLWGMGPSFGECIDEMRRRGAGHGPLARQRAAGLYTRGFICGLLGERILRAVLDGEDPSPYASIRKAITDVNAQQMLEFIIDLGGAGGMLGIQDAQAEQSDPWHWAFNFSRALTIGGGTAEIQRNIIGERLLGLPREPRRRS